MSAPIGVGHLVCGMHRSGTSMVASILRAGGVHFGAPDQLVPAAADNPGGFVEHRGVVAVDERLLAELGGAWDLPPADPGPGWWSHDALGALRRRAALTVAELADAAPGGMWGVKDPRLSLVLPFWRALVQDHRVVVCVRNPLEVALSLHARNGTSIAAGLHLWERYHAAVDDAVGPDERTVVHYGAVLDDPLGSTERLAARLGLALPDDAAAGEVDRGGRHHRFGRAELRAVGAPAALLARYDALCEEAGHAEPPTVTGAPPPAAAPAGSSLDLDAVEHVRLASELHVRTGHVRLLRDELARTREAADAGAAPAHPPRAGSVLVVQHRLPEHDRDRGSVRVLETVEHLVAGGWTVEFWALDAEPAAVEADPGARRHRARLETLGAAVHLGADPVAATRLREGGYDVCLAVFWHVAERILPLVRAEGRTRLVVDSVDLHLLRESRRLLDRLGPDGRGGLGDSDGARFARELNVYAAAELVLTVSEREARLVEDLTGRDGRARAVPLGDPIAPSSIRDPRRRTGVLFLGNFAHLPNIEAVEHLTRDVLPRLDPALLAQHPARIVGNGLDDRVRAVGDFPNTELVGWVPDVAPHLHRARVAVVPLLSGAGVKGKVVQALLAGTPVVATPIGVEGLDLDPHRPDSPVVVARDAAGFAAAVAELLTDDDAWTRRAGAARSWAEAHHGRDVVRTALLDALDPARLPEPTAPGAEGDSRRWSEHYARVRDAVHAAAGDLPPGARCLVLSGGDDELLRLDGATTTHFPADDAGGPLGRNVTADELVDRLLAAAVDWDHLVVPSTQFWQLHHCPELAELLGRAALVHDAPECRVWRLHDPDRTLVHVDPSVRDAAAARERLEALLASAGHPVVQLAVDLASPAPTPLLHRQLGTHARVVRGLGAGPAVAARGAGVELLRAALAGRHGALQSIEQLVDDTHPVELAAGVHTPCSPRARVERVRTDHGWVDPGPAAPARVSVVVATRDRAGLLDDCLASVAEQDPARVGIEVVVVDDGSTDDTPAVVDRWRDELGVRHVRLPGCGRSAAKNLGIALAAAPLVLLLDDDDRLLPHAVSEYLGAHDRVEPARRGRLAVLGRTDWAPELELTELSRHLTEVGCQLFSYPSVPTDADLDWRHFWEGRLLVPRALLVTTALHDQRLDYTIDVELGRRLDRALSAEGGLVVRHAPGARSVMARQLDLDAAVARQRAKGLARARVAALHPDDAELAAYCDAPGPVPTDQELAELVERARRAEAAVAEADLATRGDAVARLHEAYRATLAAADRRGAGDANPDHPRPHDPREPAPAPSTAVATPGAGASSQPELSVIVPVWSVTEELAEMAARTVERIREVATLRTEIVVIDNGSPHRVELAADRVIRHEENRGVAPAWNLGASVASAPLLAFVNSDCWVEPGWDRALAHAATDGRRIAFPYTDHGDGQGPRRPDQAGTAGWCFVLHRDLLAEVGGFDEGFAPAYFEDTDQWHRAWEMGVDLDPVPAAVVRHQRRTTGRHLEGAEELFTRNRRRYEAKHGVAKDAPPPFHARTVTDYPPPGRVRLARLRPWASDGADRPRVFGIGLPKTGTSSLHAAVSHLGYRSVHHGGAELWDAVERAAAAGRPLLEDVDPDLDAFCDVAPLVSRFAELDVQYPGSKFVLTVRDDTSWVASRTRHVERNRRLALDGAYHGDFVDLDPARWRAERDAHHDAVLAHFAGRPDDLLVLDVVAGQGWERLAPFLGWGRLPERPFPHENPAEPTMTEGHA